MIDVASLPLDQRGPLIQRVARLLLGSPFLDPKRMPLAVVVVRAANEASHVTDRGSFGMWLKANGLDSLAREAFARKVPRGHVLCWIELESEEHGAIADFAVVNVRQGLVDLLVNVAQRGARAP